MKKHGSQKYRVRESLMELRTRFLAPFDFLLKI